MSNRPTWPQKDAPTVCGRGTASFLIISLSILLTLPMLLSPLYAAQRNEPIHRLEKPKDLDPAKVALGRRLFLETKLSKDNTISCASCHDLRKGGGDGTVVSIGVGGKKGSINSPTVYNSGLLFRQFWDGRAESLEDQVDGPVQNPLEMASLWPDVIAKLYKTADYPKQFEAIYADGITRENIKQLIATFERSLVATNGPFDRYLAGDNSALNQQQKRGYQMFKEYGCVSCHQGAAVGGNMFQVFGVLNSYFKKRGNITDADRGRFNVTGNKEDMHSFKVPSLRMVAYTAPYLHDGSAETLRDAVDAMFEFQLGRPAPDQDKDDIVEFLKTLAGQHEELGK